MIDLTQELQALNIDVTIILLLTTILVMSYDVQIDILVLEKYMCVMVDNF